jgi:phosphoglycolate phosphatase
MKSNVLLFDVDGTLVNTGGAGRRSMEAAFEDILSRPECLAFSFAGMTDQAIVKEGLSRAGVPFNEARVDELLERYVDHLAQQVERSDGYAVCPGVEALLARARSLGCTHAVGLGTGNIKRGAEIKLARAGLARGFSFGGFGCDHEDRAELLRVGARRGAQSLGAAAESCRVVVIGDTPRDIAAAAAIGAECVAVATGPFDVEQLRAAGPASVFETLEAGEAVCTILGTGATTEG